MIAGQAPISSSARGSAFGQGFLVWGPRRVRLPRANSRHGPRGNGPRSSALVDGVGPVAPIISDGRNFRQRALLA